MSQSRFLPVICLAILLAAPACIRAITLTNPTAPASETDAAFVDLEGNESSEAVKNVLWVNQFGRRGSGSWAAAGQSSPKSIPGRARRFPQSSACRFDGSIFADSDRPSPYSESLGDRR